jgi:hypothetical protein
MAQPLADLPAVRICTFSSDNRFTTEDVKARKETIAAALEAKGITMLSYSADGDARELKMERLDLGLGIKPPKSILFYSFPRKLTLTAFFGYKGCSEAEVSLYSLKTLWPYWAANLITKGISNQDTIHEGKPLK